MSSNYPKKVHGKVLSMGIGIFLFFSIAVVFFDASNVLAIGLAFFVPLAGIMLVMVGAMAGLDNKKSAVQDHSSTRTEIIREVVKVRCKYCNILNFETSQRCNNCRART